MKKIFKFFLLIILLLVSVGLIVPIVFKKQIQTIVKKELNKKLNANINFSDISLSIFRHFPKVSILINDLDIVGLNEFSADTILFAKQVDATTNILDIIKKRDITIYSLQFDEPRIHAIRNVAGLANWDIVKTTSTESIKADTSTSNFKLLLNSYEIKNGYVLYKDDKTNTSAELFNVTHSGNGDITKDVFTLQTTTNASSVSITSNGIPYLINTKTVINTGINIDNKKSMYSFKSSDINFNNLKLSVDGFFQNVSDSVMNMDIKFSSPTNEFKNILSMIPTMYTKDFETIKTSGNASFDGFVKGNYSTQLSPAYNVNLQIKDGFFQYPDLPKPVKNIQLSLQATNIDGQADNAIIDISKGHVEIDNEPFDFRFTYKNPTTIKLIDAAAKGNIDLSQIIKFIKLPIGTKLSGNLSADAFIRGPLKAIQQQNGIFSGGGYFTIKNLFYTANDFPQPIKNGSIKATLENTGGIADNTSINISSGYVEIGENPLNFSLQINKPFSEINFAGTAKGSFILDNIKQFTTVQSGTYINGLLNADIAFTGNKAQLDKKEYDKLQLNGIVGLTNVNYKSTQYPTGINNINTQIKFTPQNTIVNNLSGKYYNTNFNATGNINNLIGYIVNNQTLSGTLNVNADKLNLNDWIGTSTTNQNTKTVNTTNEKPFVVPANINLTVNTNAQNVKYDKVDYTNVEGKLIFDDQKITLQNIKTNVLEGSALINGYYSTKLSKTQPSIGLSYDIKDMDVQKAFLSYNTIQSLMPIGKFLSGKFNSQLNLNGNLGENMLPNLKSLNGNGNLFLLKGVLQKFAPLEKLATLLQIDRLKQLSTKEIKNYIEFADGKVLVKPFTLKIDNIEMQIGGFHGFDQSIDYAVQLKLPRSVLGTQGNNLINNLVLQATNKGLPVKLSETVNLSVKMLGSINNPTITINLKEVAGDAIKDLQNQVKDFAQARVDSAKQKVKDSIKTLKNIIATEIKDKLKDKILGRDTTIKSTTVDSNKTKPTDILKNTIKDIFGRKKKPVTVPDTLKQ